MEHIVNQVETASQERELVWNRLLSSREFAQGLLEAYNTCILDPMLKLTKPGTSLYYGLDQWTTVKIGHGQIWDMTLVHLKESHKRESEKMSCELSGMIQSLYRPVTAGTSVCAETGYSQVDKIRSFVEKEILPVAWDGCMEEYESERIASILNGYKDRYPTGILGKLRERITGERDCQRATMNWVARDMDEQAERALCSSEQTKAQMARARRQFLKGVYLDIRSQLGGAENLPMPDTTAIEALTGAELDSVYWRHRESPWDKREREAREEAERIDSDYWDGVLYTESHLP